jgi:D-3-phosphoglycerate dehydrogenase
MTTTFRVLIADKIAPEGLTPLSDDPRFELITRPGLPLEELTEALADVDAVIVRSAVKVPREALAKASRLRVIGRAGVGVDTIDVTAATERGIAVLNAPAGNTISAAELTMALMLSVARRVAAADRSMKAGAWDRGAFGGSELYGKTLGLVGAGRIGSEVAARARAFGMRVLIHDPYLHADRAEAIGATLAPLDEVLRTADVISIHAPLTEATAGMIGAPQLALLKPTAVLLNVARGEILQEDALVEALRGRRIGGAGLDVFHVEPLPADHPLRTLDNVVLTPHLGASTEEAQQNVALEIAAAIRDALLEGDLTRAVNAPAIGGERMRRLRPMLDLAERLGRIGAALAGDQLAQIEVRYAGREDDGLQPLAASAVIGALAGAIRRHAVNIVNALHLAASRGIAVERTRLAPRADYAAYLEVRCTGTTGTVLVAGAVLEETHLRVVRIDSHRVDIIPQGDLVLLRNRDVPGVIGQVGTALAMTGINIGQYHVARDMAGGEALAAIGVDARLDPAMVDRLRAIPDVLAVRQVALDPLVG